MPIPEEVSLGVLAGGIGLGLVILSLSGGSGGGTPPPSQTCPLKPGEELKILVTLNDFDKLTVSTSGVPQITLSNPMCQYAGAGRDIFSYWEVRQSGVTVMASGIAGALNPDGTDGPYAVHVGPPAGPSTLQSYLMVNPNEPQPCGGTASVLTAIAWQPSPQNWPCGVPFTSPLCGGPPKPNVKGDIIVSIFEDQAESGNPADSNGLSSPSCASATYQGKTRCPVAQLVFPGAVTFTA